MRGPSPSGRSGTPSSVSACWIQSVGHLRPLPHVRAGKARVGAHEPWTRGQRSGCRAPPPDHEDAQRLAYEAAQGQASENRKLRLHANRPSQTAPRDDRKARSSASAAESAV